MKKFDWQFDWQDNMAVLLIGLVLWASSLRRHPGPFSDRIAYELGGLFGSICVGVIIVGFFKLISWAFTKIRSK
jgi:hypothetical protein